MNPGVSTQDTRRYKEDADIPVHDSCEFQMKGNIIHIVRFCHSHIQEIETPQNTYKGTSLPSGLLQIEGYLHNFYLFIFKLCDHL